MLKFKRLEIAHESNWIKRTVKSKHVQKSLLFMLFGALAGFLFFYLTEGRLMNTIPVADIFKSMAVGGFFGLFITNSPCARGKC